MSAHNMVCGLSKEASSDPAPYIGPRVSTASRRSIHSRRRSASDLRFIEARTDAYRGGTTNTSIPSSLRNRTMEGAASASTGITMPFRTQLEKSKMFRGSSLESRGSAKEKITKQGWFSRTWSQQSTECQESGSATRDNPLSSAGSLKHFEPFIICDHDSAKHQRSQTVVPSTSAVNPFALSHENELASFSENSFAVERRKIIAAWETDSKTGAMDCGITLHRRPAPYDSKHPTEISPDARTQAGPVEAAAIEDLLNLDLPKTRSSRPTDKNSEQTIEQWTSANPDKNSTQSSDQASTTPSSHGHARDQENNFGQYESGTGFRRTDRQPSLHRSVKQVDASKSCAVNGCISSDDDEVLIANNSRQHSPTASMTTTWGLRHLRNWSAISNWHLRRSAVVRPSTSSDCSETSTTESRLPLLIGMQESFRGIRRSRWGSPRTRLLRSRTVDAELANQKPHASKIASFETHSRKAESVSPRVSRLNLFASTRSNKRDMTRYVPVAQTSPSLQEITSGCMVQESGSTLITGASSTKVACLPVLGVMSGKLPGAADYQSDYEEEDNRSSTTGSAYDNRNQNVQSDYYTDSKNNSAPLGDEKMEWGDIARVHMDFFYDFEDLADDCFEPGVPAGTMDYASLLTPSCLRPSLCL